MTLQHSFKNLRVARFLGTLLVLSPSAVFLARHWAKPGERKNYRCDAADGIIQSLVKRVSPSVVSAGHRLRLG